MGWSVYCQNVHRFHGGGTDGALTPYWASHKNHELIPAAPPAWAHAGFMYGKTR
jgi:hypothetical protein